MRKFQLILALLAVFPLQSATAGMMGKDEGTSCSQVVKACLSAGYTRGDTADKKFWMDCMKPVILGKKVSGVTIDPKVVKDCKVHKMRKRNKNYEI